MARAADRAALEAFFCTHYVPLRSYVACLVTAPDAVTEIVDAAFATVARDATGLADAEGALFAAARSYAVGAPAPLRDDAGVTGPRMMKGVVRGRIARRALLGYADAANDAALEAALTRLDDRQYEILLLRWLGRLSREEIAEVLGVSEDDVARELASALDALRGTHLVVARHRGHRGRYRARRIDPTTLSD
jgi:DNA-binding CsgD family transcriptional regulator